MKPKKQTRAGGSEIVGATDHADLQRAATQQREAPLEEAIRQRAYELYQQRGGREGDPIADWLRAENEIRGLLER